jgi:sodium/potassium-transporting ATPase subunit alpha
MFGNKYTFPSLIGGALFSALIIYTPPLNIAFGTNYRLSPLTWLIGLGFGVVLLIYRTIRTLINQKRKQCDGVTRMND